MGAYQATVRFTVTRKRSYPSNNRKKTSPEYPNWLKYKFINLYDSA